MRFLIHEGPMCRSMLENCFGFFSDCLPDPSFGHDEDWILPEPDWLEDDLFVEIRSVLRV